VRSRPNAPKNLPEESSLGRDFANIELALSMGEFNTGTINGCVLRASPFNRTFIRFIQRGYRLKMVALSLRAHNCARAESQLNNNKRILPLNITRVYKCGVYKYWRYCYRKYSSRRRATGRSVHLKISRSRAKAREGERRLKDLTDFSRKVARSSPRWNKSIARAAHSNAVFLVLCFTRCSRIGDDETFIAFFFFLFPS